MFDLINFLTNGLLKDVKVLEYFKETMVGNFQSKLDFFTFFIIFIIFFSYLFLFYMDRNKDNKRNRDFILSLLASGFVTIVFYGFSSLLLYFGILFLFGIIYVFASILILFIVFIIFKTILSKIEEKIFLDEKNKADWNITKSRTKNILIKSIQTIIVLILTIIFALIANNVADSVSKSFEYDSYLCRSKMFKGC